MICSLDSVGLNKGGRKRKASAKRVHSNITHSFQITLTHSKGPGSAVDSALDFKSWGRAFEPRRRWFWFPLFWFVTKVYFVSKTVVSKTVCVSRKRRSKRTKAAFLVGRLQYRLQPLKTWHSEVFFVPFQKLIFIKIYLFLTTKTPKKTEHKNLLKQKQE